MKLCPLLIITVGISTAFSQKTTIGVEFLKNDKLIKLDNKSTINLIIEEDTIVFPISNGQFVVPDSLRKNGQNYFVNLNGYIIDFSGFPFAWNEKRPFWRFILDTAPIEDERVYLIRDKPRPVKWLGILDNGTGALFSEYRYDKLKRTKQ